MKIQRYVILVLMMQMLYCGCTTGVDELFDTSASERSDRHLTECKNLLVAATNGWQIEYCPGEGQPYGGYNMIVKFDDNGNVTVRGENRPADYQITSHYSMLSSNGVVLSFDTYNDVLHYYSDPDIGSGKSFGGDYEFIYLSGNANEMIFKGTRTGNTIRFIALAEGVDWEEYLHKIEAMSRKIRVSPYSFFIWEGESGRIELEIDDIFNTFSYVPDSSNPQASESIPFSYTTTGIKFYKPVIIGGATTQRFDWDDATGRFISTDAVNESGDTVTLELNATMSAGYIPYDKYLGNWTLSYGNNESIMVKIAEKEVYKSTFILSGLTYDIELQYNKKTGKMAMTVQYLEKVDAYFIYLCVWDVEADYLSWNSRFGFSLTYNNDDANPVIDISDNKKWGTNKTTGLLFCAFSSSIPSNQSFLGSITEWAYPTRLHK